MKSPHEPDGHHDEDVPSEVAEAFHPVPRRLEPPEGTYETLRRQAAGRRRRRGLAVVAIVACCAAAGVLGSVSTQSRDEVVRTRDVAGSPHAPSRTPARRHEPSAEPAPSGTADAAQPTTPSPHNPGTPADTVKTPAAPPPPDTRKPPVSPCASAQLKLTAGRGDGAAGSVQLPLLFTNTGTGTCTLHGFPGVALVGPEGRQLGAPASRTGSGGTALVLASGHSARADLRVARAENYPQERCAPAAAEGLRVYPPNRTQALFLPLEGFTGCSNPDILLLSVRSVHPGP